MKMKKILATLVLTAGAFTLPGSSSCSGFYVVERPYAGPAPAFVAYACHCGHTVTSSGHACAPRAAAFVAFTCGGCRAYITAPGHACRQVVTFVAFNCRHCRAHVSAPGHCH